MACEIFERFLNKKVNVLFDKLEKKRMQGILTEIGESFIFVKGDYAKKYIAVDQIIEMKAVEE